MPRLVSRYACASCSYEKRRNSWEKLDGVRRDRGLKPWSKKGGKKAWTRSTVVSERGRPTTISHLPSFPSASLASGFRCNHYVTHPLAFPYWLSLSLSLSLSLALSPLPPLLWHSIVSSHSSTWADIAPRPYLVALPIALARGMVRLLLHDAYYLILEPFLFLPPRHFLQKRPIDPTHGYVLFLLGVLSLPRISSLMPGDNTIGQVCERYRTTIVVKLLVIPVCIQV